MFLQCFCIYQMWGVFVRDCPGAACSRSDLSPELWSWRPALGMWCSAHASTPGTWAGWRRWRCPNMMLRKARFHTSTTSLTSGPNPTAQIPSLKMETGKNAGFSHPDQFEFVAYWTYSTLPKLYEHQTVTTKITLNCTECLCRLSHSATNPDLTNAHVGKWSQILTAHAPKSVAYYNSKHRRT